MGKPNQSVCVSSSMNFKPRLRNWCLDCRIKDALQHLGLMFTLMAYTLIGGIVSFNLNLNILFKGNIFLAFVLV